MKLHIPVRIFRIVIALMAVAPCSLYAKYTVPTEIGIPSRYETRIEVNDIGDIIDASKSSANVAFRIVENLNTSTLNNFHVESGAGSFYFTSHRPESLKSISFSDNTNRPFYVSNDQFLEFNALQHVSFNNNTLLTSSDSYGGAIYGDSLSSITLSYNETVSFSKNTVSTNYSKGYCYGGAIYAKECYAITIRNNGAVTFSENTANPNIITNSYGGAIYAKDCSIHLKDNDTITFNGNTAYNGGAIYMGSSTNLFLSGNGVVTFNENTASSRGSAIYGGSDCSISLSNNGELSFIGNIGPAIHAGLRSDLSLIDNGTVTFTGNTGGAIYGADRSSIMLSNNGTVSFNENTAGMGGAIYGEYRIYLNDNEKVTFSGNSSTNGSNTKSGGGAIWGMAAVQIKNNSEVAFSGNSAKGFGGAIWSQDYIQLLDNEYVTFSNNSASNAGGAIGGMGSPITLSNNEVVTFSGNTAANNGGAIYATTKVITLSDNKHISFYKNFVTYTGTRDLYGNGGAIHAGNTIALRNNETVTFSENTATHNGGAIYGDYYVSLNDNGTVTFSGNLAKNGGAIYADLDLNIRNNDSVLFAGNVEKSGSDYLLRSIYATSNVALSAAEGKSITFRDTMYIDSDATVSFNEDYIDSMEGVTYKQHGDIIFTGATTEADLLTAKGRAGTAAEILNSRTTIVNNLTDLYGGRLRVEDGAVYQGRGIMVHEGSGATVLVKDATLNHAGYELTFNSGTTLAAEGVSSISGNVVMLKGSNLALTVGMVNSSSAVMTLNSAMDLQGVHLAVNGAEYLLAGKYQLIQDSAYNAANWTSDVLSISGCSAGELTWENGVLTLTCSNTWNQAAADGATIGSTPGNLVVSGGAEVALNGALSADALQQGKGHLIIDAGVVHLEQGASVAGDVVFTGAQSGVRELVVEADSFLNRVMLATSQSETSSIEVSDNRVAELGDIEGTGNLSKEGTGTLNHTGTKTMVQGNLVVKEGKLLNTGSLDFAKIELNGGQLDNQGSISTVEINGGILSGSGVFGGLTMNAGRLVVGNSPGFQQYTDDLHAEGGELVFSVGGVAEAATSTCKGWESTGYSNIDMGGNALHLGMRTTLTIAFGGSMLENLSGDFSMVLFSNVGNMESYTSDMLAMLLENTQFIVTDEEEGLLTGWKAGDDLSGFVKNAGYSVVGASLVLSGQFETIPEPATATLSLMALAALTARRRRK